MEGRIAVTVVRAARLGVRGDEPPAVAAFLSVGPHTRKTPTVRARAAAGGREAEWEWTHEFPVCAEYQELRVEVNALDPLTASFVGVASAGVAELHALTGGRRWFPLYAGDAGNEYAGEVLLEVRSRLLHSADAVPAGMRPRPRAVGQLALTVHSARGPCLGDVPGAAVFAEVTVGAKTGKTSAGPVAHAIARRGALASAANDGDGDDDDDGEEPDVAWGYSTTFTLDGEETEARVVVGTSRRPLASATVPLEWLLRGPSSLALRLATRGGSFGCQAVVSAAFAGRWGFADRRERRRSTHRPTLSISLSQPHSPVSPPSPRGPRRHPAFPAPRAPGPLPGGGGGGGGGGGRSTVELVFSVSALMLGSMVDERAPSAAVSLRVSVMPDHQVAVSPEAAVVVSSASGGVARLDDWHFSMAADVSRYRDTSLSFDVIVDDQVAGCAALSLADLRDKIGGRGRWFLVAAAAPDDPSGEPEEVGRLLVGDVDEYSYGAAYAEEDEAAAEEDHEEDEDAAAAAAARHQYAAVEESLQRPARRGGAEQVAGMRATVFAARLRQRASARRQQRAGEPAAADGAPPGGRHRRHLSSVSSTAAANEPPRPAGLPAEAAVCVFGDHASQFCAEYAHGPGAHAAGQGDRLRRLTVLGQGPAVVSLLDAGEDAAALPADVHLCRAFVHATANPGSASSLAARARLLAAFAPACRAGVPVAVARPGADPRAAVREAARAAAGVELRPAESGVAGTFGRLDSPPRDAGSFRSEADDDAKTGGKKRRLPPRLHISTGAAGTSSAAASPRSPRSPWEAPPTPGTPTPAAAAAASAASLSSLAAHDGGSGSGVVCVHPHRGAVPVLAITAWGGGGGVATGCADGCVRVWQRPSRDGPPVVALASANGAAAVSVAASACGRYVAAAFRDRAVSVVDVAAGGTAVALPGAGAEADADAVAFCGADVVAAATEEGEVAVWRLGSCDGDRPRAPARLSCEGGVRQRQPSVERHGVRALRNFTTSSLISSEALAGTRVHFSPDGLWVGVASQACGVCVWTNPESSRWGTAAPEPGPGPRRPVLHLPKADVTAFGFLLPPDGLEPPARGGALASFVVASSDDNSVLVYCAALAPEEVGGAASDDGGGPAAAGRDPSGAADPQRQSAGGPSRRRSRRRHGRSSLSGEGDSAAAGRRRTARQVGASLRPVRLHAAGRHHRVVDLCTHGRYVAVTYLNGDARTFYVGGQRRPTLLGIMRGALAGDATLTCAAFLPAADGRLALAAAHATLDAQGRRAAAAAAAAGARPPAGDEVEEAAAADADNGNDDDKRQPAAARKPSTLVEMGELRKPDAAAALALASGEDAAAACAAHAVRLWCAADLDLEERMDLLSLDVYPGEVQSLLRMYITYRPDDAFALLREVLLEHGRDDLPEVVAQFRPLLPAILGLSDYRGRSLLYHACGASAAGVVSLLLEQCPEAAMATGGWLAGGPNDRSIFDAAMDAGAEECLAAVLDAVPRTRPNDSRAALTRALPRLLRRHPHLMRSFFRGLPLERAEGVTLQGLPDLCPLPVRGTLSIGADGGRTRWLAGAESHAPRRFWRDFFRRRRMLGPRGLWDASVARSSCVPAAALLVGIPGLAGRFRDRRASALTEISKINAIDIAGSPTVRSTLEWKWAAYGRSAWNNRCVAYALFLALFTVSTLMPSFAFDSIRSLFSRDVITAEPVILLCAHAVSFSMAATFLAYEFYSMARQRSNYLNTPTNWLGVVGYSLLLAGQIWSVVGVSPGSEVSFRSLSSFTALMLWLKLITYFRPYRLLGPYVRLIVQVMRRVSVFLLVMLLSLMAFIHAFFLLYKTEGQVAFSGWRGVFYVYLMMLGQVPDESTWQGESGEITASVLALLFTFLVTILLMNLLIAIMSQQVESVETSTSSHFWMERLRVLVEIDATLAWPLWSTKRLRRAAKAGAGRRREESELFPRWIHSLGRVALRGGRTLAEEDDDVFDLDGVESAVKRETVAAASAAAGKGGAASGAANDGRVGSATPPSPHRRSCPMQAAWARVGARVS